jgi:hypothetical protein
VGAGIAPEREEATEINFEKSGIVKGWEGKN